MDDAWGPASQEAVPAPQPVGRGRPPSTTRHQLQEIAMEMFSAHGYDEVTLDELAAAAGIGRRTFFRYFPSKADALMARLRLRLQLQSDHPALQANANAHYERWQQVIAEFAACRLGQSADALQPQVIARAIFGAAFAGFMSWLCDDAGDLGSKLDAALGVLADSFGNQPSS
jgi:AcrR family transcriptional regulator